MAGLTYDAGALVAAERHRRELWALHRRALERGARPTVPAGVLAGDYASLHEEGKDDRDRFLLYLNQLLVNALAETAAGTVSTQLHTIDGHDLCRVQVLPSSFPVDATVVVDKGGQLHKKVAFYVRIGNGTREITDPAERQKYIASRWGRPPAG